MKSQTMSPNEIRKLGIESLFKALGPTGMVRFLQQFDTGTGDYTAERHKWLENLECDDVAREIEAKRKRGNNCHSEQ